MVQDTCRNQRVRCQFQRMLSPSQCTIGKEIKGRSNRQPPYKFSVCSDFLIFAGIELGLMMRCLKIVAYAVLMSGFALLSSCEEPNLRDPAEQLAIDIEQIDNHIAASGQTAYKDITGIRFTINSLGAGGLPPNFDQQVTVKYNGRLLDGTQFDDGSTTNYLGNYILGWQRGLPLLPKGTKATLYIPSGLAYGVDAYGPVPGNSVLVFDIELQDVILSVAEKLRAPTDIAAIDKYLKDNSIVAVADTTGVRYVITQEGSGAKPGWHSRVRFNYTGKLLSGEQFVTGTAEPSAYSDSWVVDYIHGVKIALTKLGVGAKGTFYIPSGLAFGANARGSASVPAHSNVFYELELLEILPD
jgi:FKBP-type peptidyl-prolyl cis-trans isomerase